MDVDESVLKLLKGEEPEEESTNDEAKKESDAESDEENKTESKPCETSNHTYWGLEINKIVLRVALRKEG